MKVQSAEGAVSAGDVPAPPLALRAPPGPQASLLDRVALTVNSSLDLDEVLERLLSLTLEACPADRCSIFLLDGSGTKLVPRSYLLHPDLAADLERMGHEARPRLQEVPSVDLEAHPSRLRLFEQGKAFTVPDLASSPLVPPEVVSRYGARSALVVPLVAPDEPLGVLALDWMAPKPDVAEAEVVVVEAIGAYAALAIRNARLFEKEDEKARSLERLVEVAAALNSSLSLHDALDLTCDSFAELLGSDRCSIVLIDERSASEPSAGETGEGSGSPRRIAPGEAAPLLALWRAAADPLVFEVPTERLGPMSSALSPGTTSAAVFPLLHGERVNGFAVVALRPGATLAAERAEIGKVLAGLAATATERAELHERLRGELQQVEVLRGLSDAVAGTSDLSAALRELNVLLTKEVGIELDSISLANERLREALDADVPADAEMEAIRSWRATRKKSRARLEPRSIGDVVLVPIAHRGRVQGVLRVRPSERSLDPAGAELLLALGRACSEVIHKAGLHRDLAESERRLAVAAERERIAQDLHDSIGQLITGLGMRLGTCAEEAPDDEWRRRLEELVDLTSRGSRQMQEAIHSLLFFRVRRRGLVRSLRELAQTFELTTGVVTTFQVRGRPAAVDPDKEDALFRVAHEAFTNVQRHSEAPSVSITLTYDAGEVALAVRDHGSGFGGKDPLRERPGHLGLAGIRRRMEEAGGELLVANAHPRGVLIEARLPLRRRRSHATHPGRRR